MRWTWSLVASLSSKPWTRRQDDVWVSILHHLASPRRHPRQNLSLSPIMQEARRRWSPLTRNQTEFLSEGLYPATPITFRGDGPPSLFSLRKTVKTLQTRPACRGGPSQGVREKACAVLMPGQSALTTLPQGTARLMSRFLDEHIL